MREEWKGDALVVGASGGIAGAVLKRLVQDDRCARIFAVSRAGKPETAQHEKAIWINCEYAEGSADRSIESVCGTLLESDAKLARVVICNGVLHGEDYQPEKRIESLSRRQLTQVFEINAIIPVLWLKALLPVLEKSEGCTVSVLSARVGSIADNRLGGWYSYRASKAALNMLLKTATVEYGRRAKQVKLIAFHPGTTDTALSAPFRNNVPDDKLFTPDFVAERLLGIMDAQQPDRILSFLDWDGKPVDW